jgi:hypothetical protein
MLAGDVQGHAPLQGGMSSMDCYECHGDPPDVLRPGPAACVVCHEPGFDRLLQDWRAAIDGRVQRLHASRSKLGDLLAKASPEALQLVARSDAALGAVEQDGSRGAHNVGLALDLLQEAATSLDQAGDELGLSAASALAEPAPWRPEAGCATCHAGLESRSTIRPNGRSFSHRAHVERAGLDCAACHDLQQHGQPAFPRDQCATCHHAADASHDANDCGSCHQAQATLQRGELAGFAATAGAKSDLECSLCHGSPPDIAKPSLGLCNVCHEEGFESQLAQWRSDFDARRATLAQSLEQAVDLPAEQRRLAESALRLLTEDGSRGVHNPEFSRLLLEEGLRLCGPR